MRIPETNSEIIVLEFFLKKACKLKISIIFATLLKNKTKE